MPRRRLWRQVLRSGSTLPRPAAPAGRFTEWLYGATDFTRANSRHGIPSIYQGTYGLGLRVPDGVSYKSGQAVMTIPPSLWAPFSADAALAEARRNAPTFLEKLEALERHQGLRLTAPMALSVYLALMLMDPEAWGHEYARMLYETSLPPAAQHPLLLTSNQLHASLQASPLVSAIVKRQELYTAVYSSVGLQEVGIPLKLFLWAISRVLSRAISGEGKPLTFLPYFDMLNHSSSPNCEYTVESDGRVVVMCTRDVGPAEELFITYGPEKDNHKLMLVYGFASESACAKVKLRVRGAFPAAHAPDARCRDAQMRLLQRLGHAQCHEARDVVVSCDDRTGLEAVVPLYLVLAATEAEVKEWDRPVSLTSSELARFVVESASDETWSHALQAIEAAIGAQLQCYATTLEDDKHSLQGAVDLSPWTQSCLRVVIEEKAALRAALARLGHMQGELKVNS